MMNIRRIPRFSGRQRIALGGAALLAVGIAGGAGAVSLTRPSVEMAPTVPTAVSNLPGKTGIVTVRGRVAAVYGNDMLVQDQTGRTLVDAGRAGAAGFATGNPILVQGRYENGQLRARYLVDASGTVRDVAPPPGGPGGPGGRGAPPPPPPGGPGGPGAPPPPPPGGPGMAPPPPPPPGAGPAAPGGAPQPGMAGPNAPGGPGAPPPPPPPGAGTGQPQPPMNGAAPAAPRG